MDADGVDSWAATVLMNANKQLFIAQGTGARRVHAPAGPVPGRGDVP